MYRQLADVYDVMYDFKDYESEAAYITRLVRDRNGTAQTLLETACGTGRFLEFLGRDFAVEGLDLSEQMLERGRERLPGVPFHHGDMTGFELPRTFDVVCCLFRSIAHCRTSEKMAAAITAMARHVKPNGLLVIEPYFTPASFWDDHVALNQCAGKDMKLAWMYVQKRQGTQVRLDIHCLAGTREGVTHFTETVDLGLFTRAEFEQAFAQAGLQLEYDPVGPSGVGLYIGTKNTG